MAAVFRPGMAKKGGSYAFLQATRTFSGPGQQQQVIEDEPNQVQRGMLLSRKASAWKNLYWQLPQKTHHREPHPSRPLILKASSNDEATLESYTQFVTRAARVFDIDCSGKVMLEPEHAARPIKEVLPADYYELPRYHYKQKKHSRGLQINEMKNGTGSDFLQYIQQMKPKDVSLKVWSECEQVPFRIADSV